MHGFWIVYVCLCDEASFFLSLLLSHSWFSYSRKEIKFKIPLAVIVNCYLLIVCFFYFSPLYFGSFRLLYGKNRRNIQLMRLVNIKNIFLLLLSLTICGVNNYPWEEKKKTKSYLVSYGGDFYCLFSNKLRNKSLSFIKLRLWFINLQEEMPI